MRGVILAVMLALGSAGAAVADFDEQFEQALGGLQTHLTNVAGFKGNVEKIFTRLSPGQQAEIRERLEYVCREGQMSKAALEGVREARTQAVEATGSRRQAAFARAIEAFEDYRALHDVAVQRSFVDWPEPRYLRLQKTLAEVPWYRYGQRAVLRKELETAFLEYSDGFVLKTLEAAQPRRDAFFHALKNLQYCSSGFDLGLQYRFDRAFYGFQALCRDKAQPGYGMPVYADFPVDAPLAPVLVFRPTQYGKQYSEGLKGADVTKLLPEAYSDIKELPQDALSREARRIKELQELVSTYERAAQRGDRNVLGDAWSGYVQLRDRWDKVEVN